METNDPVYAGLWGLHVGGEVDFGHGVSVKPTYMHVMAHTMLAFNRPERPGAHHPAPWKATSNSYGYDVEAQLCVPVTYVRQRVTRVQVAKSLVALLRLYAHPDIRLAFVSPRPFEELGDSEGLVVADQMEIHPRHFDFGTIETEGIADRLQWIQEHWETALDLMESNSEFQLALDVYLTGQFIPNAAMVMVAVWGALEALFTGSTVELKFRVSAMLAAYMKPRGPERSEFQKKAAKLYDKRSAAAHGSSKHELGDLIESFYLLRSVLIQMIEVGKVPTKAELEAKLFED